VQNVPLAPQATLRHWQVPVLVQPHRPDEQSPSDWQRAPSAPQAPSRQVAVGRPVQRAPSRFFRHRPRRVQRWQERQGC
jgi:hypothetical protein